MRGNDIVDMTVAAAESNWRRKGFLEKIFTLQEQEYIQDSPAPDEIVWKLWTMKESAYKIYTRQYGGRFFAPQKFSCTIITTDTGIVKYDSECYQTTTISAKKYIYSIARPEAYENTGSINSCFSLPAIKHTEQQQFIYKKIADCYHAANPANPVVKHKNGIPFLLCSNNIQVPISITHHGHFAAFTIN